MFFCRMANDKLPPGVDDPNHGTFDAHMLRAYAQEGGSKWYRRPRIAATPLKTTDIRKQIQAKLPNVFGNLPGKRLAQHLSYVLLAHSADIHFDSKTADTVLAEVRYAMVAAARGTFLVDKDDPIFYMSRPAKMPTSSDKGIEHVTVNIVDATKEEQRAATALIGTPNLYEDISRGPLSDGIRTAFPHLLSLDASDCMELAFDLRRKLHSLIEGEQEFAASLRVKCVEAIADLWNKSQPTEGIEELVAEVQAEAKGGDIYTIGPDQMMNEYLNPVLDDAEAVRRRLKAFELATFVHAIEGNQEASARCSTVWETVFPKTRTALCDAHNNIFAYLASVAAGHPLEKFRKELGAPPVFTPRAPTVTAS